MTNVITIWSILLTLKIFYWCKFSVHNLLKSCVFLVYHIFWPYALTFLISPSLSCCLFFPSFLYFYPFVSLIHTDPPTWTHPSHTYTYIYKHIYICAYTHMDTHTQRHELHIPRIHILRTSKGGKMLYFFPLFLGTHLPLKSPYLISNCGNWELSLHTNVEYNSVSADSAFQSLHFIPINKA